MWFWILKSRGCLLGALLLHHTCAFVVSVVHRGFPVVLYESPDGQVGSGPNWIERSFPVGDGAELDTTKIEDWNVKIDGKRSVRFVSDDGSTHLTLF